MSDEVKQAAERLRQFNAGTDPYPAEIGNDLVAFEDHDQAVLAAAYLAEHDPSNALPLTAEILEASGWKPGTYGWIHADVRLLLFREEDESTGWRVAGLAGNARVETVGDLRKLTEALHIDAAVVVVPKGGEPC